MTSFDSLTRIFRYLAVLFVSLIFISCGNRDLTSLNDSGNQRTLVLSGSSPNPTSVQIVWAASANVDLSNGIQIFRNESPVETLTQIPAQPSWTENGLQPSTTYRYRLTVLNENGSTAMSSNTVTVTTGSTQSVFIEITPVTTELLIGTPLQLTAKVRDSASGAVLADRPVSWSSSDGTVATVSATGLVNGHTPGPVGISASTAGARAQLMMLVSNPPVNDVVSVTVSPSTTTVEAGKTAQLSAIARDSEGRPVGRVFAWSTSNPAVATVSQEGVVTAVSSGLVIVRATTGETSGTAQVTVSAPNTSNDVASVTIEPHEADITVGESLKLNAIVRNARGVILTGHAVTWASENPIVATVTSNGMVTAQAVGGTVVTAEVGGASGSAVIISSPVPDPVPEPVATISISPSTVTIATGATAQFVAELRDADGRVLTGRTVVWSSGSSSIAVSEGDGLVRGILAGTSIISASSEGVTATATLKVEDHAPPPPALANLVVIPTSLTLRKAETRQITAEARDISGNVLTGRVVGWTSSNSSIAVVSPTGQVTAVSAGTATITASSEGHTANATVTVSSPPPPAPVNSLTISPSVISSAINGSTQFVVVVKDMLGNVLTGRVITWTSSDTQVATVSSSGLALARAAGTVTIQASSEGKTATTSLTVNPPPVATLKIDPATLALLTGQTAALTATLESIDGEVLTGRTVTWASSNTAVATVSPAGMVTAVGAGAAIVTATSEGISSTASVTVGLEPVATLSVEPDTLVMTEEDRRQVIATTRLANGTVVSGRVIVWSSANPNIASVSPTGEVEAVRAGSTTVSATSEGRTAVVSITVEPLIKPVASIDLIPPSLSITEGKTGQFIAVLKDENGVVLENRDVVWSTSNSVVATVSPTGVVTGVAVGNAQITASSEGITRVGSVTVGPRIVASVDITSLNGFCAGTSLQLSAIPRDADGNILTGRAVTWTTSNVNIATVSSSGMLVGLKIGDVTVTATVEGVSTSATISLCAPVVASIDLSAPNNLLSLLGLPMQLLAVPRDANGNVVPGANIEWSVSPPLRALLSIGGLLTPLSLGDVVVTARVGEVSSSITIGIGW